jgi:hypothetical protein
VSDKRRIVFERDHLEFVYSVAFALSESLPLRSQAALERRAAQYLPKKYKTRGWRTRMSHAAYHVMCAIDAKVIDQNAY